MTTPDDTRQQLATILHDAICPGGANCRDDRGTPWIIFYRGTDAFLAALRDSGWVDPASARALTEEVDGAHKLASRHESDVAAGLRDDGWEDDAQVATRKRDRMLLLDELAKLTAALAESRSYAEDLSAATVVLGRDNDRLDESLTAAHAEITACREIIDSLGADRDETAPVLAAAKAWAQAWRAAKAEGRAANPAVILALADAVDLWESREPTGHVYLSTACHHGHHDYCRCDEGQSGPKTPATCKWCPAPCRCGCHAESREEKSTDGG